MHNISRTCILTLALTAAFPALGQSTALDNVVVTATRTPVKSNELLADTTVIGREEIQARGYTTLTEVLANVPGIFIADGQRPGKDASTFTRGTNTGHTLLLIDGMPLTSATLGAAPFELIPAQEIERIEVLRGPASALYGSEAIGGVVQVFTRRGEGGMTPHLSAKIGSFNTREVSGGVSGGTDMLSYALSASSFDTDGFNISRGPLQNPDRDGYSSRSSSGSFQLRPASGHEIGASYLYTDTRNHVDGDLNFDNRLNTTLSTWNAYSRNKLSSDWTSSLRYGQSRNDQNAYDRYDQSRFATTQKNLSWQNDIATRLGTLQVLLENQRQDVESTTTFTITSRTIRSSMLGWSNSFGAHRLQVNTRRDNISAIGAKDTWSAAYGYQFTDALRLFASQGTAFKAPSFSDMYYYRYDPTYMITYTGNPNLKPETSKNSEIGIAWEKAHQEARFVYFDNRISDLIDWGSTVPENIGKAKITGSTTSYQARYGNYTFNTALDLLRPLDANTGKILRRRAQEQLVLGLAYNNGAWTLGGDLKLVGERYDDKANLNRLAGVGLINLHTRYRLDREWSLEGQIKNLTDRRYDVSLGYADTHYVAAGRTAFIGLRYAPK